MNTEGCSLLKRTERAHKRQPPSSMTFPASLKSFRLFSAWHPWRQKFNHHHHPNLHATDRFKGGASATSASRHPPHQRHTYTTPFPATLVCRFHISLQHHQLPMGQGSTSRNKEDREGRWDQGQPPRPQRGRVSAAGGLSLPLFPSSSTKQMGQGCRAAFQGHREKSKDFQAE